MQAQAKAQLPEDVPKLKRRKGRPEKDLQDTVIAHLQTLGYLVAHFRPARVMRAGVEVYETPVGADGSGFPDIIAVHPENGACLALELKSSSGRVSDAQLEWLRAFTKVPSVTTLVVTPETWAHLEALL